MWDGNVFLENITPAGAGLILLLLGLMSKRSKSTVVRVLGWIAFIVGIIMVVAGVIGFPQFLDLLVGALRIIGSFLSFLATAFNYAADYLDRIEFPQPAV
jgi:hypothetical protein